MRFLLSVLLTIALGFIAGVFLEWWSIAIIAFLVAALLPQSIGKSFLSGFVALFILWSALALWINIENDGLLASKVATLFGLDGSSVLMILVTGLVAAIVGGFAAMSGSSFRKL